MCTDALAYLASTLNRLYQSAQVWANLAAYLDQPEPTWAYLGQSRQVWIFLE